MLGVVYLIFSALALIVGLYHMFFFSFIQESESVSWLAVIEDPDYLALRAEFWGTLLLGLCLALALEGISKLRRSSIEE